MGSDLRCYRSLLRKQLDLLDPQSLIIFAANDTPARALRNIDLTSDPQSWRTRKRTLAPSPYPTDLHTRFDMYLGCDLMVLWLTNGVDLESKKGSIRRGRKTILCIPR